MAAAMSCWRKSGKHRNALWDGLAIRPALPDDLAIRAKIQDGLPIRPTNCAAVQAGLLNAAFTSRPSSALFACT
jgi:hypothetical protein